MTKNITLLGFIIFFLATASASAIERSESNRQLIETVISLSGHSRQIEQIQPLIDADFSRQKASGAYFDGMDDLEAATKQVFKPAVVYELLIARLQEHYDGERFRAARDLLSTSLARKMADLEVKANSPEAQQEMNDYFSSLQLDSPPENRIRIIEELVQASNGVDGFLDIQIAMAFAMMRGAEKILPPEQHAKEEDLPGIEMQMRMQMRPQIEQFLRMLSLYTYRDASDEELEEYTELYSSETGQWLISSFSRAYKSVFEELSTRLGQTMAEVAAENTAKKTDEPSM